MKYKNRVRSRISNLKDSKNPELKKNVLCGAITPEQIAVMTSEVREPGEQGLLLTGDVLRLSWADARVAVFSLAAARVHGVSLQWGLQSGEWFVGPSHHPGALGMNQKPELEQLSVFMPICQAALSCWLFPLWWVWC